jgi:hypothetical protein
MFPLSRNRTVTTGLVPIAHFVFFAVVLLAASAVGQEMEPGAYGRAPVGTNFILLTYAYQTGDVLVDSSLPLRDVSIELNAGSLAYGRTFGLLGRQTNIAAVIPYIKGSAQGVVFENLTKVTRSGLGDMRVRFAVNLHGSPALAPKEFARYKRKTVVGASVIVVVPTGQYDPARLVNLGSNRWAMKPEVGISKPMGKWTAEAALGVWLYTANRNFFGGRRREQTALLSLQGNLMYTFRPRLWVAASGTYYRGGHTIVNGAENADVQSNSRYGGAFSYPLTKHQSLRLAASRGLTARFGGKLSSVAIGWQYTWF